LFIGAVLFPETPDAAALLAAATEVTNLDGAAGAAPFTTDAGAAVVTGGGAGAATEVDAGGAAAGVDAGGATAGITTSWPSR
jgi:hypothetical protein